MKKFVSLIEAARAMKKPLLEVAGILEAEQSHDQIEAALRNHLRGQRTRPDGSYVYKWLRATYDSFFIYEETDDNGVEHLFKADYSIGDDGALVVGNPVEVRMDIKYIALTSTVSESRKRISENFISQGKKRVIADDGTVLIKLIDEGVGSSGYYGAEVLKAACEAGVFPPGLQMFSDHMTAEERKLRPEGSVKNLTAVTREAGHWLDKGPDGPGVYAKSEIYEHQRAFVESVGRDIGVSVDGLAEISWGEINGREMPIIEKLVVVESVDFVTRAGRGGKIVPFQEAARDADWLKDEEPTAPEPITAPTPTQEPPAPEEPMNDQEKAQITESAAKKAVANFRTALTAAREAVAPLALPEAVKARIAEAQAENVPLTTEGKVDVATIAERAKEAAATEANFAREAYGYGVGTVQNGASQPVEVESEDETKRTQESKRDAAALSAHISRLGR